MEHETFYPPHAGVSLKELADRLGAELLQDEAGDRVIRLVSPVYRAKPSDICYILSRRNKAELETCDAGAILCDAALRSLIPEHIPVLLTKNPHAAFALAGQFLHPEGKQPLPVARPGAPDISPAAFVDPTARLEDGVVVEPMAVIGADVEIGAGSLIGAGAVIGRGVKIGRDCSIAAGTSIIASYIGNGVIIHNGARIGQDGFGYAPGSRGMVKIVQIGRVIIQDNVEIGANTTIDRGTMDDTVIGEGTKIDNQVQIAHNVRIGRHCGIVAQVGIAGSTVIGDGVLIGGGSGVNGHIKIGDGVQIAAMSGVIGDLPPGEKFGGIPARPLGDFLRDCAQIMGRSEGKSKVGKGQK
ncbi:UDP-3-O-(3-hydroxymyristoyl)glucosamine N-acyltransferase [Agrobacterium vitis]|uniref:UDP-3-O-(3-hydroxymyristoyl)glucosamine N-acyltransferase n=1 Tax=Agrobacterium vitis TaxID=373 RepID=UPI0015DAE100|nr:UDP-3-O-(3-hydroxymyristoyl)glucosamine N-acyltransferase [Agrobacterium vitis]MCF1453518.1 UDP-3-O-(3-hydroxymyristoyl)glucosamine N-acyltransferase [Agrobacterium vitis]BCH54534.1 UDP-3-O-acylglucosamine N-acyltransferase [Agrobacterium vitis]